jgi:hypothetical protein
MNIDRKVGALLACLAAAGLLAACGSSASSSSSGSGSGSSAQTDAGSGARGFAVQRAKLESCLKQHGVTLPPRPRGRQFTPGSGQGGGGSSGGQGGSGAPPTSGSGGPPGGGFGGGGFSGRLRSNPKLQAAFKACASDFPRGGFTFRGAARKAAVAKFVTCVREHGYDLPKPNFSGRGPVFPSNIQSDPKFRTASRSCAKLLVPRGTPPQGAPAAQGAGQPNA